MVTLEITIRIASQWPTPTELALRNAIEADLLASRIGQCVGAGGGLGEMHLAYRVNDESRARAARAAIDNSISQHMPGFQYAVNIRRDAAKGFQVKVGDIFAIPLAESAFALSLCTFVFNRFKDCVANRIFDSLFAEPRLADPLPITAAFDPMFMADHVIADGTWPIVGRIELTQSPILFRCAGAIYDGDDYLRPEAPGDDLPMFLLHGPVAVQNVLRRHFGARLA